jgi:hypothetical protein
MKTFKILSLITLVVLLSATTSCKKKFFYDKINEDPTALNTPEPTVLLPAAEANLAYFYGGDLGRLGGVITQQMLGGSNQFIAIGQLYNISDDQTDNSWNSLYTTTLNNLNKMDAYAEKNGNMYYVGIGKILTAYTMCTITDMWGDAPYSEAFMGAANLKPHYDSQESIYAAMHKLIDEGVAALGTPSAKAGLLPGSDDFIYGGKTSKWIKFAHALKARMYLHTVKKQAGNEDKALAELAMGFTSSADDAMFASFDGTSPNPLFQFQDERSGDITYVGSYLYDTLAASADPRLPFYVDTTGGNDAIGPAFGSMTSPVYFMSYMEQKFIEAELQARKGDHLKAKAAYDIAVTESFALTGASGAAAYLLLHPYPVAPTLDQALKVIMTQKYYAMFTNPESWTDVRRTGYPVLTPVTGASIPRRLTYPQSETLNNKSNMPSLTVFSPVWWNQ